MKEIDKNNKSFEEIKHINENGVEFWYARELMHVLQYSNWQNFEKIIDKSKISCRNSDINVLEHFIDVSKTIKMPKGAEKTILDHKLTRYACYIIAQNGDNRKKVIAKNGGTMPEDLPTPQKSLKQLEKENKKLCK